MSEFRIVYKHTFPVEGGFEPRVAWRQGNKCGVECGEVKATRADAEGCLDELAAAVLLYFCGEEAKA